MVELRLKEEGVALVLAFEEEASRPGLLAEISCPYLAGACLLLAALPSERQLHVYEADAEV